MIGQILSSVTGLAYVVAGQQGAAKTSRNGNQKKAVNW